MRLKIAGRAQAWGCLLLLSWAGLAYGQDPLPPAAPPDDPLVVKPETISQKFNAALFMLKLARLDLAKHYLQQTLDANPTDEDLLELRKTHGTGVFLQISALEELNPPATELLNKMNAAIRAHLSEPGYAEGLLQKLSGSPRDRLEALAELRHLGPDAVPPIIQRLAQGTDDHPEVLITTLKQLGSAAAAPLVGALTSPVPEVRAVAAQVLGHVGSTADAIWLWAPAFGEQEPAGVTQAAREALARIKYGNPSAAGRIASDGATRQMLAAATQHLTGQYKWPELDDELTLIPVWTWDAATGTVVEHAVPRANASIFFAERLAREALQLTPDSQLGSVVLLASLLSRAVEEAGWQLPLNNTDEGILDLAVRTGPEINEQVLRFALDHQLSAAALGSLQALAQNGSPDLLIASPPHGAVVAALDSPDMRVQFAAAVTILSWDPVAPFRGSRRVVEILARTLNSDPQGASVVMDTNELRGNQTAGMFTELGFPAALAPTGQSGFRIAAERGDIELAVLDPNVLHWELTQTIANLRADARTASIPVVIYGPAAGRDRCESLTSQFQNVAYIDEGTVPVDLSRSLRPFLAQISPPPLSPPQREQQITEASFWLRRIAIRNVGPVFDLLPAEEAISHALGVPQLAEDSLISLGAIGTVGAQRTLMMTATAPAANPEMRSLAASQLAYHMHHFGMLLSPMELASVKASYDQETDGNVRLALASVIGTLKPSAAAVRNELLAQPMSPAPVEPATQQ